LANEFLPQSCGHEWRDTLGEQNASFVIAEIPKYLRVRLPGQG